MGEGQWKGAGGRERHSWIDAHRRLDTTAEITCTAGLYVNILLFRARSEACSAEARKDACFGSFQKSDEVWSRSDETAKL